MLKASNTLIAFIEHQRSRVSLARRWGVSVFTIYKILSRRGDISGATVAAILADTGFDFDTAFVTAPSGKETGYGRKPKR